MYLPISHNNHTLEIPILGISLSVLLYKSCTNHDFKIEEKATYFLWSALINGFLNDIYWYFMLFKKLKFLNQFQ